MSRADADRNRERIVAAATKVLAANRGATFEQIIAATGLGRTTVYRHFPSRDALLAVLVDEALRAALELIAAARPDHGTFLDALERTTRAALHAGAAHWSLLTLVNEGFLVSAAPVPDIIALIIDLMRRGHDERALRADLPLTWCVEVYLSLLYTSLTYPAADESDAVHTIISALLGGFGDEAGQAWVR